MHIFHVAYSVSANNTYKMTSDQDYHRRLQKSSDTVWLKFYFVSMKTNQFLLLTGFCMKRYLKDFFLPISTLKGQCQTSWELRRKQAKSSCFKEIIMTPSKIKNE